MSSMPVPNENHKKLHALAGSWIGDETLSPSPWGPGGTATGRVTARADLDGFFVLQDYVEEKDGKTVFKGHGVFGWDDANKVYTWFWFDSMGSVPEGPARGQWEGDTLLFTRVSPGGQSRYTYRFEGASTYHLKLENSFDGGKTWATFMEGVYRRA